MRRGTRKWLTAYSRLPIWEALNDEDEPEEYYLEEIIPGQTIREVLNSIQYSEQELLRLVKSAVDSRVKAGKLKPREGVALWIHLPWSRLGVEFSTAIAVLWPGRFLSSRIGRPREAGFLITSTRAQATATA